MEYDTCGYGIISLIDFPSHVSCITTKEHHPHDTFPRPCFCANLNRVTFAREVQTRCATTCSRLSSAGLTRTT